MTTVETATYGVTLYDGEDANGLANIVGMLLEIVDSRIAGWDITLGDTIADNASCGLYVLGDVQPRQSLPDLTTITMTMTENGTLASRGVGADCLGSPWRAWRGWRTSADPSDRRFAPARSCSPAPSAPWSPSNRARHTPRRSPASAPHGFDNLGQSRLTEPTRRPRASQAGIHSTDIVIQQPISARHPDQLVMHGQLLTLPAYYSAALIDSSGSGAANPSAGDRKPFAERSSASSVGAFPLLDLGPPGDRLCAVGRTQLPKDLFHVRLNGPL